MKNKQVVKDERGYRWYVYKNSEPIPANWKHQCYLVTAKANREEIQEKLYGKKK